MRKTAVAAALLLAACGAMTPLSQFGTVAPRSDVSAAQQEADAHDCKGEANSAAASPGQMALAMGQGGVGGLAGPAASTAAQTNVHERAMAIRRSVFADCMGKRGYTVTAPG